MKKQLFAVTIVLGAMIYLAYTLAFNPPARVTQTSPALNTPRGHALPR